MIKLSTALRSYSKLSIKNSLFLTALHQSTLVYVWTLSLSLSAHSLFPKVDCNFTRKSTKVGLVINRNEKFTTPLLAASTAKSIVAPKLRHNGKIRITWRNYRLDLHFPPWKSMLELIRYRWKTRRGDKECVRVYPLLRTKTEDQLATPSLITN